jgi:crotonobetainyl-CoA:carnitine CoA-transferase CaiB-like acyl-CoA transferase
MAGALQGMTVLEFGNVYAAPFCTLLLKDLGAEVIKVERITGGDTVRNDAPLTEGNESGTFIILNRGKKSITLNIASEKGRDIVRRLTKHADALIENFSPGTMDKLGLSYEDLCKVNPKLIYASISGYGHTGPRRDEVSFDPVAQAMGGMTAVNGFPERPVKCGVAIADFATGMFTALAIVAAYLHVQKTGEGQRIDMSLQDCVWQLSSIEWSPFYFIDGKVPVRTGNGHPKAVPGNLYPSSDGSVRIDCGALSQVQRLFRVIGGEELVNSPFSCNQAERIKHKDEIDALVAEWTQKRTAAEIVEQLKKIDVPCSIVPSFDQVCNDEQLLDRDMIIEIEQLVSGPMRVPGSVFKLSKTPGDVRLPAPFLGEHNTDVYSRMLGYTEEEIETLAGEGII